MFARSLLPTALLLLAIAGALFLRAPQLGLRPLHNDESVNAVKLAALWEHGEYEYDPDEYHGPTLHYFSLPFLWFGPAQNALELSDAQMRVITVAFGVGLILLLVLLRDALGRAGTLWAAAFLAVSPAMVFYSRYFIHEMLLVFFTMFTLAAGWRYQQSRQTIWAALTGVGIGLMFATKETFVLTMAALGFALLASRLWNRWRATRSAQPAATIPKGKWTPPGRHLLVAGATCGLIWLVLFTSFFSNWRGLLDSFTTYLPWLGRAGGDSPHIHPWYFYFQRLLWFHPPKSPPWTELSLLLLAGVAVVVGFFGNRTRVPAPGFVRFLAFFTFSLAGIYSVIPYKTPWCALNFWLGVILLAGIGATVLIQSVRGTGTRWLMGGLIGVGVLHLGVQAWLLTREFTSDLRNPYVYAQTSPHERELSARVNAIGRMAPDGFATVVKVMAPESYWPLPWTLRAFQHVGWYEELPDDPFAPIVIASAALGARLDDRSDKRWIMAGYYELRPRIFVELYVELELWKQFVATLPRPTD